MSKRTPKVELLPPAQKPTLDDLASIVAEKLARRSMQGPQEADEMWIQPWFLPREISYAVLSLLPLNYRRKFAFYFNDYGCFRCGRKDVPHHSNGLCHVCHLLFLNRLRASFMRHGMKAENEPTPDEQATKLDARVRNAELMFASRPLLEAKKEGAK